VLRITLLAAGFVIGDTLPVLTLSFHTCCTSPVRISHVQQSVVLVPCCVCLYTKGLLNPKAQSYDLSWQMTSFAGPNGVCVREVSRQSGADIKSWTDKHRASLDNKHRPCRNFLVQVGTIILQHLLQHFLTPHLSLLQCYLTVTIAAQHAKQTLILLSLSTTVELLLLHWRCSY